MGKKVLIATLYNPDPVLLGATKVGPDRLILLINEVPNKEQEDALKLIQGSLGKVIEVKVVKTNVYDVVKVAERCVTLIDDQPREDEIYINITAGRKTMAIGLLFAAYVRHDYVKKIAYYPEEDKNAVVYLPRLCFKLSDTEKKALECIEAGNFSTTADLAKKMDISSAMVYRAVDSLKDMDLITTEDGLKLTDAGRIARL